MKKLLLLALFLVTIITLTGCSDKNSIVGRWTGNVEGEVARIEIFKDGSLNVWDDNRVYVGTWLIHNEFLIMSIDGETETVKFSINKDTMIWTRDSADTYIFTRVR